MYLNFKFHISIKNYKDIPNNKYSITNDKNVYEISNYSGELKIIKKLNSKIEILNEIYVEIIEINNKKYLLEDIYLFLENQQLLELRKLVYPIKIYKINREETLFNNQYFLVEDGRIYEYEFSKFKLKSPTFINVYNEKVYSFQQIPLIVNNKEIVNNKNLSLKLSTLFKHYIFGRYQDNEYKLIFKDGDVNNLSLDNLECVQSNNKLFTRRIVRSRTLINDITSKYFKPFTKEKKSKLYSLFESLYNDTRNINKKLIKNLIYSKDERNIKILKLFITNYYEEENINNRFSKDDFNRCLFHIKNLESEIFTKEFIDKYNIK